MRKFWKETEEPKNTCARCGEEMDMHTYITNTKEFIILGKVHFLHFCKRCWEVFRGEN